MSYDTSKASARVKCTCTQCGTVFTRFLSQIALGGGKYCSKACKDADNSSQTRTCEKCGKQFIVSPSQPSKFCSRECYKSKPTTAVRVERTCEVCSASFQVKPDVLKNGKGGRFCSVACKAKGQSKTIHSTCPQCKQPFTYRPSENRTHCSKECELASYGTFEERFWSKVDKDGPVPTHRPELGNCWVWTAGKFPNGYGQFKGENRTTLHAHRVSRELTHGTIPEGDCVLHKCDNKSCVRPDHLFTGTQLLNIEDRVQKDRTAKGEQSRKSDLTEDDVRSIRDRHSQGQSYAQLSICFGVSTNSIMQIVRRSTWKHVV